MGEEAILEMLRRETTPDEYRLIRQEWKTHSLAEDARDLDGLLSTLTEDCVYEVLPGHRWQGHAGARRFYTELLSAFPDIKFELTDIVIGPQGVGEVARVRATHRGAWLEHPASGGPVAFTVVIFFPWDRERRKFRGERVHVTGLDVPGDQAPRR
jgi:predicted ester cyclase